MRQLTHTHSSIIEFDAPQTAEKTTKKSNENIIIVLRPSMSLSFDRTTMKPANTDSQFLYGAIISGRIPVNVSRYAVTIQLLKLNDDRSLVMARREVLTMVTSRFAKKRLNSSLIAHISTYIKGSSAQNEPYCSNVQSPALKKFGFVIRRLRLHGFGFILGAIAVSHLDSRVCLDSHLGRWLFLQST